MLDTPKVGEKLAGIKANVPKGAIAGIEDPNEYDISKPGTDTDWVNRLKAYCKNVYNGVKGDTWFDGITVVDP